MQPRRAALWAEADKATEGSGMMPYKSDKQRKFMHAKHPEIAKRWDQEAKVKSKPKPKSKKGK